MTTDPEILCAECGLHCGALGVPADPCRTEEETTDLIPNDFKTAMGFRWK